MKIPDIPFYPHGGAIGIIKKNRLNQLFQLVAKGVHFIIQAAAYN
jgi:hypothetical protein